jgi:hypothetical protein
MKNKQKEWHNATKRLKIEKVKKFYVLKCWMFSLGDEGFSFNLRVF